MYFFFFLFFFFGGGGGAGQDENIDEKLDDIFLIFAQYIYSGYMLEPPLPGSSNK